MNTEYQPTVKDLIETLKTMDENERVVFSVHLESHIREDLVECGLAKDNPDIEKAVDVVLSKGDAYTWTDKVYLRALMKEINKYKKGNAKCKQK